MAGESFGGGKSRLAHGYVSPGSEVPPTKGNVEIPVIEHSGADYLLGVGRQWHT